MNPAASASRPPPLVLASASPRRRQLLEAYGYAARVEPVPVEESEAAWLSVRELVLLNAVRKCAARARRSVVEELVVGVDTLVCLDGQALGKPATRTEAAAMLTRLGGRAHQVYSGVCLAHAPAGQTVCFVEETQVIFRALDAAQIEDYLILIDPLDKAGGYAAQEHGERIIAGYEGSWTNVMGLPMETLAATLAQRFAVHPGGGAPK